jgi:hypothetical protein
MARAAFDLARHGGAHSARPSDLARPCVCSCLGFPVYVKILTNKRAIWRAAFDL